MNEHAGRFVDGDAVAVVVGDVEHGWFWGSDGLYCKRGRLKSCGFLRNIWALYFQQNPLQSVETVKEEDDAA
ncbi:hypothetical protein [Neisseria weixii]|uniref:hypothetical protein n=1 Tax=Neisseria weixii TaxID=1853276 RepID=UPI0018F687A9|nr:hypothetical protein [Neisseria weixii]